MRQVLFHRRFRSFTGGHMKVWDYFNHVRESGDHAASIYFTSDTVWNDSNPWNALRDNPALVFHRRPAFTPDILFVAGRDWQMLPNKEHKRSSVPVINLIQSIFHADPPSRWSRLFRHGRTRYDFLAYRAIRICASTQIADAITATGRVNGPLFVIPYGLISDDLPAPNPQRDWDVLILGLKNPSAALEVEKQLRRHWNGPITVVTTLLSRAEFLALINRSQVTVFLPCRTEGFYIPALEGMALGTVVVCPDCGGNRSFCVPGDNCFRPNYAVPDLVAATLTALKQGSNERQQMVAKARGTALRHDIMTERRRFLELVRGANSLW